MNGADIRMIERRGRVGFPLKTLDCDGIGGHVRRQELQRHMAMQLQIFGFIHHTHPAAAQLALHAVVRDGAANHDSLCRRMLSGVGESKQALQAAPAFNCVRVIPAPTRFLSFLTTDD